MASGFKLQGVPEFKARLKNLTEEGAKAAKASLYQQAEGIMSKAKLLTPLKTGNLRGSGHVQWRDEPGEFHVILGFGGPAGIGSNLEDVGYAVPVHENLNALHAPGTQAKYLAQPYMEAYPNINENIKDAVRRASGWK